MVYYYYYYYYYYYIQSFNAYFTVFMFSVGALVRQCIETVHKANLLVPSNNITVVRAGLRDL
jgi:hypothetical protein